MEYEGSCFVNEKRPEEFSIRGVARCPTIVVFVSVSTLHKAGHFLQAL
jgi:hypothetical protein